MRYRYFAITTIVLIFVSLFSLSAHNYLAGRDADLNTDLLLKQTGETLFQTDWANPARDFQRVESILSQELGSPQINRFFILKDASGNILYKSYLVSMIGLENIATFPEWLYLIKDDWRIRVYNITDHRFPDRILQVGLIADINKAGKFNDFSLVILFFSIGALGVLSSWLLSNILFSPISKVGIFLNTATEALDKRGVLPNVPKGLFMYLGAKDELRLLTEDLDSLLNKINTNYKTSRLWASQMAHELKTPLSQLLLHIEATTPENDPNAQKSFHYIKQIKYTINAFLDWAELENNSQIETTDKVNTKEQLETIISLIEPENKERIRLLATTDFTISCNQQHFVQLAQNLISNALKYSEKHIDITLAPYFLKIQDYGPGIPQEVLEKVGDPFNFGNSKMQKKGHGLGLAWIKTICSLHDWNLQIQSTSAGTICTVEFLKNKSPRAEGLLKQREEKALTIYRAK